MRPESLLATLSLLSLVSCSSVPEHHSYSLVPTTRAEPGAFVLEAEIRVEAPSYLSSVDIAMASDTHELTYASYHQWVEPVEEGIARALRRELEGVAPTLGLGGEPLRIDVHVDRFHGTLTGEVLLDVTWRLTPANGAPPPSGLRFSSSVEQAGKGYGFLVEAHHALIQELAREIASAMAERRASLAPDRLGLASVPGAFRLTALTGSEMSERRALSWS